jgi:uncharacterized membrane protein HdeD (DUF308 family)
VESQPGGYRSLAAQQRGFLSLDWLPHLAEQVRYQHLLDGAWSRAAPYFALLGVAALQSGRRLAGRHVLALVALTLVLWIAGSGVALALLAGSALWARRSDLGGRYDHWLAAGFLGTFFLLTFLYHPYARLLLPLILAGALWAGAWLDSATRTDRTRPKGWRLIPVASVLAAAVLALSVGRPGPSDPWRAADGFRNAAAVIESYVPAGQPVVVVGEPSLQFYLHTEGRPSFERIQDMAILAEIPETYVVTGVYAKRTPSIREGLERLAPRLERIATIPVWPKDLRVLDDYPSRVARRMLGMPDSTYLLTLYRLRPAR